MIEGILPTATSNPLMIPSPRPIATAIKATTNSGKPRWWTKVAAVRYALRPTIDPTLRSMFRVRMTIVSPTATTRTIATFCAMPCQLLTVRKFDARAAKKMIVTARPTTRPISRRRKTAAEISLALVRPRKIMRPP
jgi:hypothetical protein